MSDETFYQPPPIQGYQPMSQAQIDLVNSVKRAEQTILAMLRNLADDADIDPRYRENGLGAGLHVHLPLHCPTKRGLGQPAIGHRRRPRIFRGLFHA